MNNLVNELKATKVFYIATVEEDQPRVRPFGSVCEFEGKLYVCTNNTKDVYRQLMKNPKVEMCGMNGNSWIRVSGELVRDDRDEARKAMLEDPTGPSNLYSIGDGIFEVFYLDKAQGVKYTFGKEPEVIK